MGQGLIAAVMSVIAALLGQARISSRPDRAKRRISTSIAPLQEAKAHPELASSQERLVRLIEEQIEYLAKVERKAMGRKYDPSQPVIGALVAVPCGYFAYHVWNRDGWGWQAVSIGLWIVAVTFVYVGIAGFFTPPRTSSNESTTDTTDTAEQSETVKT